MACVEGSGDSPWREIHIHRKVDEAVEFVGKILPWNGDQAQIADAAVHIQAIDGESGDEFQLKSDRSGKFRFKTIATKHAAIAYSPDKRFAGSTG